MALESLIAVAGSQAFASTAVLAGTGVSAYGALYQGAATAAAAEYNSALLARNARISREQAAADAQDKAREAQRYLGMLHAAFGASGLAMEGSALDVYEDQAREAELAVRRVLYGGEVRATGLEGQAALEGMKADAASTAGYLGAAAQVAGGAASYYRLKAGPQGVARGAN